MPHKDVHVGKTSIHIKLKIKKDTLLSKLSSNYQNTRQRILNTAREKCQVACKGILIRLTATFSAEAL